MVTEPTMTPQPDEMITLAKRDGEAALGPLLELYRNYLTLLARVEVGRRLQRKLDASDLVQETFLDAHKHFGQFEGGTEAQFLAWLRRILACKVANTVRHFFGTQGRDVRQELENALVHSLDLSAGHLHGLAFASVSTPSGEAIRREHSVLVANALQDLPEDYREVIVLRHWEGLTFPDVAGRMGRTVDSVEKLWIRALSRLRKAVGAAL